MSPEECQSLSDVRSQIDSIDRDLVALLGRRLNYVKAAAKFKVPQDEAEKRKRFVSMLRTRREWAELEALNPEIIEEFFTMLIKYYAQQEHLIINKAS